MNSVFVILLVNIDMGLFRGYFKNEYSEFSHDFYANVGVKIIKIMIILVLVIPIVNLCFSYMYACIRCCDRGCTQNSKKTKKLT